jgi:poly(3-hydroxybutyrate) depolymerase
VRTWAGLYLLIAVGCRAPASIRYSFLPSSDCVTATAGATPSCEVGADAITCTAQVKEVGGRDVYWQVPPGPVPERGWPVVVLFHGSFYPPSTTWTKVPAGAPYGGYQQARLQAMLLAHGFAVIAPKAVLGIAWQSNAIIPWSWTQDRRFLEALFAAIDGGAFGPIDAHRQYATGISSGGYQTSRMALGYPGRFRALAIQSASWANCMGFLCSVPSALPPEHPPTLFLHGAKDHTVPASTARDYFDRLAAQGTEAELDVDRDASHQWLSIAPERITRWFECH